MIIEKLQKEGIGYKDDLFKISALFFADDGLVLAQTIEEAKRAIKILTDTAGACGLNINKQKSHIMVYNKKKSVQTPLKTLQL